MVTNRQIAMVHQDYLLFSQVLPVTQIIQYKQKIKQGNLFKSKNEHS